MVIELGNKEVFIVIICNREGLENNSGLVYFKIYFIWREWVKGIIFLFGLGIDFNI